MSETDTHYTLQLDLPGVTREQLKVTVEGRRVTLETVQPVAETAATNALPSVATPAAAPAVRELYRERSAARYARTVNLPAEVGQAASHARFDNGVLTLTLAKKVPTGAMQISID